MIELSEMKKLSENFFRENRAQVMAEIFKFAKVENEDQLWEKENHLAFGLDCGLVYIIPYDKATSKQWKKEDEYKSDHFMPDYPYRTQSTTLQEIQANMLIEFIKDTFNEDLGIYTWID